MLRLALNLQGTSYGHTVEHTHGVTHISGDTEGPNMPNVLKRS